MLVRDFEEQQSEKENQIHHLKATATNTIRNLYALNGLTGENISNNIEAQQLKRSISNNSLDFKGKDSRKKVSFEGLATRFSSTLGVTGERGDNNETINLTKSSKLLSPYRNKNAAYTTSGKSSLKKTNKNTKRRDADSSVHSVISPLSPTSPAKYTKLNRSRLNKSEDFDENDFERNDQFIDGDRSMYGIPYTIDQIDSTSALVTHLKNLLNNALDRESKLTDFIEKICSEDLQYLKKKYEKLYKANFKMREDSERLLMRNEELETRLLDAQSKLWTLKLLYDDYDEVIQTMNNQKNDHVDFITDKRNKLLGTIDNFLNSHGIPRKGKNGEIIKGVGNYDDEIHYPTLFKEVSDLINDLKNKLKESLNVNKGNMQTIDSLKKELEELDKINERLENQLYKYQYDITRITDVLLNDVYPSAEELEQEEESIEDMSEQEQHLYLLLKRASTLRDKEKDYGDKINIYMKDIEELMDKNRILYNVEEIK